LFNVNSLHGVLVLAMRRVGEIREVGRMLPAFPGLPVIAYCVPRTNSGNIHRYTTQPAENRSAKVPHALTKATDEARMRTVSLLGVIISGLSATIWCSTFAAAQSTTAGYPSQPVRIVVPFAAGGATDVTARIIGQKMAEEWGATVIIENKPGATGAIAAEYVAKANPDGYTLLMGTGSVNSVFPAVKKNLPFDTLRDFAGGVELLSSRRTSWWSILPYRRRTSRSSSRS
jgi:hypothetical protein